MDGVTSSGWTDFLTEIQKAKSALGDSEAIWYRGHGDSGYYLLPSFMRAAHGLEKEKFLFNSFQKFSKRIFQERESEWETLFEMQHYGIPTRLIDWSETFGIALFFAAYYQKSDDGLKDAAIYLLNPNTLNQISGVPQVYRLPKDEKNFSYTGIYWDHRPFAPVAPIAIEPNFIND